MIHACRIAILGDNLLTLNNFALLDWILEIAKNNNDCFINKFLKYNELGKSSEEIKEEKRAELRKIWFIASILHDIGYLFETFRSILKSLKFFENIPKMKLFLNEISNTEYNCLPFPKFEHGDLSDLFIRHLSEEAHPSLIYAGLIAKNHSTLKQIDFFNDPLSSLLIILDEFQEWNRPVINIESIEQFLKSPLREDKGKNLLIKDKEYENGMFSLIKNNEEIQLEFGLLLNNKPSNLLCFKLPLALFDKSKMISRINLNNKDDKSKYKLDLKFFILVPPELYSLILQFEDFKKMCKNYYEIKKWYDSIKIKYCDIKEQNNFIELNCANTLDYSSFVKYEFGGSISLLHSCLDSLWKEIDDYINSIKLWYKKNVKIEEKFKYISPQDYLLKIERTIEIVYKNIKSYPLHKINTLLVLDEATEFSKDYSPKFKLKRAGNDEEPLKIIEVEHKKYKKDNKIYKIEMNYDIYLHPPVKPDKEITLIIEQKLFKKLNRDFEYSFHWTLYPKNYPENLLNLTELNFSLSFEGIKVKNMIIGEKIDKKIFSQYCAKLETNQLQRNAFECNFKELMIEKGFKDFNYNIGNSYGLFFYLEEI